MSGENVLNVGVDMGKVGEALQAATTDAIAARMASYEVKQAIATVVAREVAEGAVARALEAAVAGLDVGALTTRLAEELSRAVTGGMVNVIREAMADLVVRIRGIPEYDREKRDRARAEVLALLTK